VNVVWVGSGDAVERRLLDASGLVDVTVADGLDAAFAAWREDCLGFATAPLAGALLLWLVPPLRGLARQVGLVFSLGALGVGIWALTLFDPGRGADIQLAEVHPWIPVLGISWALGVNALGLAMLLLAAFLVPVVLLASWGEVPADRQGFFTGLVLALEAFIVVIFSARDVFLFYVCFEAMLVPVYFLIGRFGGPERRRAALKFLLYSLAGGLVMLIGVVALFFYGPHTPTNYLIDSLAGSLTVVGDPQDDPGTIREGLHGLGETEVLLALQEGDDVTALTAPETVEETTRRGDGETRGLLVVERAQPLP